jgi:hypothetical protein
VHVVDFVRARTALVAIVQQATYLLPIFEKPRELTPEEVRALTRATADVAAHLNVFGAAITETDGKPALAPEPPPVRTIEQTVAAIEAGQVETHS